MTPSPLNSQESTPPQPGPPLQPQAPEQQPQPGSQPPPRHAQPGPGLETDLNATIDLVKKEVPTSLSGMARLPISLFLILLGAGLAILLGLLFFLVQLGIGHILGAFASLLVCMIFGGLLVVAFAITRRKRTSGAVLAALFSLVLIAAGGTAGWIGGIIGFCGAGMILLKEIGILDK